MSTHDHNTTSVNHSSTEQTVDGYKSFVEIVWQIRLQ